MKLAPLAFMPPQRWLGIARVLIGIGTVTFLIGLVADAPRTWANLLLVSYYLLSLGLAGVVFVALHYVTGAGWGVAFRRVPEALFSLLPVGAAGLVLVWLAQPSLYSWTSAAAAAHGSAAGFKHAWLSWPFFLGRATLYLGLWLGLAWLIRRHSRLQDNDGQREHTNRNVRLSAVGLVIFGVTIWLASYDWLMSLEPEWYSTIFGVYQFAGLFQAWLAAILVLVLWLKRYGPDRNIITADHLHDLGKLLFGFSTFWAYIAYCQYMLIWYVNNPEETSYFIRRTQGAWLTLLVVNVVLNWAIPFLVLLPQSAKRRGDVLGKVAWCVLLGRWVDLYLMIVPANPQLAPNVGVESGLALGAGGAALLTLLHALQQVPLIPRHDPYLLESLPSVAREHPAHAGIADQFTLASGSTAHPLFDRPV